MGKVGKLWGSFVDRTLDLIYSKDKKYERWLILIVLFGFILRLIASLNEDYFPDDAIYASQSAGIINAGILSTHSHPPLFFYLTDLAYNALGYSVFASRIFTVIAGTLLILITFFLTNEIFKNKRIALLSAFFVSLSAFLIRMSFNEHSLVTFFLVFFGMYLGLVFFRTNKNIFLVYAAILLGLGCLTKYNAVFFVFSFLLFGVYYYKNENKSVFTRKNIKRFILFGVIIFFLCLPFLAFNYILYKEKGLVDFQFNRVFKPDKAQELYGNLGGQDKNFVQSLTYWPNYSQYNLIYKTDVLLLLFGLFGLGLWLYRKQKYALVFFGLFLIIPFVLQSAGNGLAKHFVFMHLLFAIPAGYALNELLNRFGKKSIKYGIVVVLTIILLANLGSYYGTPHAMFDKSAASQLKEYINENVKPNELIVFDPRIYTAKSFWMATPNNFLLLPNFNEFYEYNQQPNIQKVPTRVYFVECAKDDCGWGWVAQNQEFNKSNEDFFETIVNVSKKVKTIEFYEYEGNEFWDNKTKIEEYRVYALDLNLNPSLVEQTKQINSFYFAPYLYLNMQNYIYDYPIYGFEGFLHKTSKFIIYLSMILAIIALIASIILILYYERFS